MSHNKVMIITGRILSVLYAACLAGYAAPPAERSGPPEPASQRAAAPAKRSPLREPPGVFFADVTQANISRTICISGWTATVRPSTSFTGRLKLLMLARAGPRPVDASKYELDHYVPLALRQSGSTPQPEGGEAGQAGRRYPRLPIFTSLFQSSWNVR
jgi:hypothetical protein